ncbi:hypothetical protein K502DRAFT_323945 [Neoconidiobolus thromboides FSU 785]|nr:hypothetical protein K502DRAFT_323945 [Neoconidiobolus thromboides FSU 785]
MVQFIKDNYERISSNTRIRRIVCFIIGIALWCIIVLPVILTKDNNLSGDNGSYIPAGETEETFEGVNFHLNFQSVDSAARKINLYSHIFLSGGYSNEFGVPNENITCNLLYAKSALVKGKLPDPITFTVPIIDGNVDDYPFEVFTSYFSATCEDTNKTIIPIAITTDRDLLSYSPAVRSSPIKDLEELIPLFKGSYTSSEALGVFIQLTQPLKSKIFSIFVMIVMWGLSIALFVFTYDIIISRRDIPPPLLAVGISMLFALPALRNSQPGIPIIGCLADIAAFFWCMAIIAICSMMNIFAFALRWRKPVQLK